MQHYEARFSDGYVVRRRAMAPYACAWRVFYRINGDVRFMTGFSVSRDRAEAAIAGHAKTMSKRTSRSSFASSEIVTVQAYAVDDYQALAA